MFKNIRKSITDEDILGCLSTSTTEKNIKQVRAMIRDNKSVNINDMANHLRVSHGSAHGIIQD
jgi:Mn-dependent DtxR family transcriptional regulator